MTADVPLREPVATASGAAASARAESLVRVAVDVSSASLGGGVTYLYNLLPLLDDARGVHVSAVLCRDQHSAFLRDTFHDASVHVAQSRLSELRPNWRRAARSVDVVFVPTEMVLWPYSVPTVTMFRNVKLCKRFVQGLGARERVRSFLRRLVARFAVARATTVIAVSQFAADVAAECLGTLHGQTSVVYHGVNPTRLSQTRSGSFTVLWVSTINRHKRLDILLEACRHVGCDLRIVVAGDGVASTYGQSIAALGRSLGENIDLEMLGPVEPSTLQKLYGSTSCLVWTSSVEAFGLPLVEAASSGLPVIAPDDGPACELLGDYGTYYAADDPVSLAAAIERQVRRPRNSEPGQLPRTYDWRVTAACTAALLRSAAGHRGEQRDARI